MAFQSFSSYLARAVDYAQKTKWTIEGLGKKVIAPENNIVDTWTIGSKKQRSNAVGQMLPAGQRYTPRSDTKTQLSGPLCP